MEVGHGEETASSDSAVGLTFFLAGKKFWC